ncbi:nuclear transport factor 2 family protein [Mycolicibacterium phlei]|jgi:ketosteroid isomerase-like protein
MATGFRAAVEAGDLDAVLDLVSDDVVFRSPVVFTPYVGKDALRQILSAVLQVFEDFRYLREFGSPESGDHALMFAARVGDKEVEGCDFLRIDASGKITELTVMVRPMKAMLALAERMKSNLAT